MKISQQFVIRNKNLAKGWKSEIESWIAFSNLKLLPRLAFIIFLISLGSSAIAQRLDAWTPLANPDFFSTFALDPIDTNIIYAGSYYGVYKSIDGGTNWTETTVYGYAFTNTIAINPVHHDTLFLGVELIATGGYGIYRSVNRGNSWARVYTQQSISTITIDPMVTNTIYAGSTSAGVLKSTDGGTTWVPMNDGLSNLEIHAIAVDPYNSNVVYVGTESGIYKSSNGGSSWVPLNTGLPSGIIVNTVAIYPVNSNIVFIGTKGDGLYKSTDGGGSWSLNGNGIPNSVINCLIFNPVHTNTLYASTPSSGMYRSRDIGISWNRISSDGVGYLPGGSKEVGEIRINPLRPEIIYAMFDYNSSADRIYKRLEDFTPPAAPQNLKAVSGSNKTILTWNKNSESDFAKYRIYYDTYSPATTLRDSTTRLIDTTKTITGLVNGTTYYFRITAVDSSGLESGYSNEVNAKPNAPPAAPQSLTATAGNAQVTLKWNKNTEPDFLRYRIYGGTASSPTIQIDSTTAGITDTTKIITGLANGTTYYFRITAVDSAGLESGYSNEVNATPLGIPTITSFTPTSGPIGTTVTITGTNFDPTAANNIVYFGAVKATVTAATSTSLSLTVPTGATYAPITVTDLTTGLTVYSSKPFVVTIPGIQIGDPISFASHVDFTTGEYSSNVAISDVDGDGKPDFVVVNRNSNTISVFRNTSASGSITAGSFAAKVDFMTGTNPNNIVIGDVDGDGKPDLVVANWNSNTISIFRNTSASGSITASSFASRVDFTLGMNLNSFSVAISDIDGDGKPDLVVANDSSNTVSVLRNTSTPGSITASSFASTVDFTTGMNPMSVAIGDVDGDSKPDVVVTNSGSNTISVFRNTSVSGSITASSFASKVDFTTGEGPNNVAIGDLDGDGKPDLVVTNPASTVSVFRNTSTPGSITASSFAPKVDLTGANPQSVAIGDVDGNGKPDLVVANLWHNVVSVFRNTSASGSITVGSFTSNVDFTTGTGPNNVAIGDLDGDGKPDLVVINSYSNNVSILRNTIGTLAAPKNLFASAGNAQVTLKWNKNTESDFVRYRIYGSTKSPASTLIDSTSGGANDTTRTIGGLANLTTYYFRVTAVNNSGLESGFSNEVSATPLGIPTVTSFTPTSGPIGTTVTITGTNFDPTAANNIVYFGAVQATVTSASTTSLNVIVPAGATYQPITVTVNGLTGYSRLPFIVTFAGGGAITSSSFSMNVDFTTGSNPRSVAIGDLDGDGKPDLAVANYASDTVSVLRNTGTIGSVSFAAKVDFTTDSTPSSVAIGDLDGDGKPDLAVANYYSNTVSVFRNTGTIGSVSFASKVDYTTGYNPCSVVIGDVDGDGKPDLAVAVFAGDNTVSVFRNTGTSGSISFAAKVDLTAGSGNPNSVAIGDVDGDWKPDLALVDYGSDIVSVFRNTCTSGSVSFAVKVDFTAGTRPVSVAISDVDGDGKPDLAVVNSYGNAVSVFRNTGTIGSVSFAAKADFTTGIYPQGVAIGDVDGDGKSDLLVVSWNENTVSIFRNAVGTVVITPPSAPTNLTATAGNGQVTLKWSKNTEPDFLRYRIYSGTSSSPTTKIDSTTGGITDTAKIITGLTNGTTYYFRITAVDSAGLESGFSNEVSATPISTIIEVPTLVLPVNGATSQATALVFRWSLFIGAVSYHVQVATDLNFVSGIVLDDSNVTRTTKFVSGLTNNTTYYWRVKAKNVAGTSSFSSVWNFTTGNRTILDNVLQIPKCTTPPTIDGTLDQCWKVATEIPLLKYEDGSTDTSSLYVDHFATFRTMWDDNNFYVFAQVTDDTVCTTGSYWWENDCIWLYFDGENEKSTSYDANDVLWPYVEGESYTNPERTGFGKGVYAWAKTDVGYNWELRIPKDSLTFKLVADHEFGFEITNSDRDNDIEGRTNILHWWTTSSLTWADASLFGTAILKAVTTPNVPPVAPQNLAAVAGNGQVALKWSKNTESDFLRYRIYGGISSNPTTKIDSTTGGISDTTKAITGLTNGTTYYFHITAVDSAGLESGFSNEVSAKPNAPPAVPQSLSATAGNAQVILRWRKNTDPDFLRYRIYGGTSSSPTIKMDSTAGGIADTTKIISTLTNGTIYYFRITAVDSAGLESDFSNEVSARPLSTGTTAPTVSTSTATSITLNSAVLNGTVNPNGSATTAYFEWGTSSTLSSPAATPSQSVGSGGTDQIVTANLTGLNPATTYYYCVVGDNNIGTRRGSIANFTTVPASVSLSSPSNGATNQLLTLSLGWTASAGAAKYHLQVSTSSLFNTFVVDDSTLTTTSSQVGPLSFGTTYYWRVSASNNSGGSSPYSSYSQFTTIPSPPATITANTTISFLKRAKASDYKASDYHIIGLPGTSNIDIGSILTGTQNTDWQVYWDNGTNTEDSLKVYDGSTGFRFSAGRAFWLISKNDVTINRSVNAASLNASYEVEIPLHIGWNLITNPFASSLVWSKIQNANTITSNIFTFTNGSFSHSTNFDPYVGYYFFNGTPNPSVLSVLKIPYQSLFTKIADVPEVKDGSWRVNVELLSDGVIDGDTQFGVSEFAKPELDVCDVRKPRAVGPIPEVYFERKEWDYKYPAFSADIRPTVNELEQWTFTVKSEPRKQASLTFKGVAGVPRQNEIYLVDRAQAEYKDLRKDSVYKFVPVVNRSEFSVYVGKKDAVLKKAMEVVPTEFSLGQNFPNPFNPTTSFSVRLPVSSFVTLTVFNILGQPVRLVYSGNLEAGQHWFTWDGRNESNVNVPSGVYYCRLDVAGVKSFVTKMVMIK